MQPIACQPVEMKNDVQIVVRMPAEMADAVKAYAEDLAASAGVPVSTATAVRKLLESGLAAVKTRKGRK